MGRCATPLDNAGFTDPSDPARADHSKIEGVGYLPARDAKRAILGLINDNDLGLVVPIPEQLDILAAPAPCALV